MNNSFDLTGFIGRDPEIRENPNTGEPIATASLAVDSSYRHPETSELVERTDWFDLTVYRKNLVLLFEQHVKKGSGIRVRGYLRKQVWESKDRVNEEGQPRLESRIALIVTGARLGQRPKDEASPQPQPSEASNQGQEVTQSDHPEARQYDEMPDEMYDDVPY